MNNIINIEKNGNIIKSTGKHHNIYIEAYVEETLIIKINKKSVVLLHEFSDGTTVVDKKLCSIDIWNQAIEYCGSLENLLDNLHCEGIARLYNGEYSIKEYC